MACKFVLGYFMPRVKGITFIARSYSHFLWICSLGVFCFVLHTFSSYTIVLFQINNNP